MFLIHVRLAADNQAPLPDEVADIVRQCARVEDRLEHVSPHPEASQGPVLGLYLLSRTVEEAELTAVSVCTRALQTSQRLRHFRLLACNAAPPPTLPADCPEPGW
ncbi:hypothetical protein ACFRCW_42865 [Streptomyces sp. NPDC056653]|uniref:hypothetical protein n=1 Tax=Streptomyces sp. NPDC056653 TaxID=3345894 RepID=UPI003696D180